MEDTNKREHPEYDFVQLFVETYRDKKKQGTNDKESDEWKKQVDMR